MKILFLIDNLSTGGAQRQMINLSLGLQKKGYRIEFFCYSEGDLLAEPIKNANIPIYWHLKKRRYSPNIFLKLRKTLEENQYDIILSFLSTPNFYAIISRQLLKKKPRLIISERFCDPLGKIGIIENFIRQFYRFADYLTVNSHHQRINFVNKYPWIRNKISTIYNGYDLSLFSPPQKEPDNSPIHILVVASISPYKNGLCLVNALTILGTEYGLHPVVNWVGQRVMYGERRVYYEKMQAAINKHNLENQWNWLDQKTDIVSLMHQNDVLVHPSYGEGLPNVVCEALACGRPVIVSNTLDHPYLVEDNVSGFLFDWTDPRCLSNKIIQFNNLKLEERMKMGTNGRLFAEKSLSLSRYVTEYENIFKNL